MHIFLGCFQLAFYRTTTSVLSHTVCSITEELNVSYDAISYFLLISLRVCILLSAIVFKFVAACFFLRRRKRMIMAQIWRNVNLFFERCSYLETRSRSHPAAQVMAHCKLTACVVFCDHFMLTDADWMQIEVRVHSHVSLVHPDSSQMSGILLCEMTGVITSETYLSS